jgi:hypothetical protein
MSAAPELSPEKPATAPAPAERISYLTLVFRELKQSRTAIWGLWSIAALFALGVYAPLISLNQPLLFADSSGWSSPWLRALFDRLQFESAVDIFFNLILAASPLHLAAYWIAKRRLGPRFPDVRGKLVRTSCVLQLVLFTLVAPERLGSVDNPLH